MSAPEKVRGATDAPLPGSSPSRPYTGAEGTDATVARRLVTTKELTDALEISKARVHQLKATGAIAPAVEVPGRLLWDLDGVLKWDSERKDAIARRARMRADRKDDEEQAKFPNLTHGKQGTYSKGCRCRPCVESNRDHMRAWRAKRKAAK